MNPRRPSRKTTIQPVESLDGRIVPSSLGVSATAASNLAVVEAKGGATLGSVYREYADFERSGGSGKFNPIEAGRLNFQGTSVEVDLRYGSGDLKTLIGQLEGIGMKVLATVPRYELVEGYLPIAELPTVVENSHEVGIMPVYKPSLSAFLAPNPTAASPGSPSSFSTSTPLSKAAGALNIIDQEYAAYLKGGSSSPFVSSQSRVNIQGDSVGVDIRVVGGNMATLVAELKGIGMRVAAVNSAYGIIEGALPIAELATVNNDSHVVVILPVYRVVLG